MRHSGLLVLLGALALSSCGTPSETAPKLARSPGAASLPTGLRSTTLPAGDPVDTDLGPFECSPGFELEQMSDLIAGSIVRAQGPNTPEDALVHAALFSSSTEAAIQSGTVDMTTFPVAEDQLVIDVSEPPRGLTARVTIDRFDDTWVVTGAKLCVRMLAHYDEDE